VGGALPWSSSVITKRTHSLALVLAAFAASACKTWSDPLLIAYDRDGGTNASETGPIGVGPLPTPAQVAYQRTELTAFIHFGLQTFDGTENGDSSKDTPTLFNPTNLDVDQWMSVLKSAGFRQVMLTAKHATGFCLWPSAYTDYSLKNSPWKNGQGDLVKDFTDSARAAGLRIGLYLLPWDKHFQSSTSDYETYFRNQLAELLSNYGPIDEIHMEGVLAPTSLNWAGISQLAKRLQPRVLVMQGTEIATTGADIKFVGNQSGQGNRSITSVGDIPNGGPSNVWYPSEAPVSDRNPDWFWHAADSVMSLTTLKTIYFNTVGMNTTLLLNVPPAQTGQLDGSDVALLQQFGAWYADLYRKNLLRGSPAVADSEWASTAFDPSKAVDDDLGTYWVAASGKTSGRLEVTPPSPITFSLISIREPIELGERSTAYHVEIRQNGSWRRSPTDTSGVIIAGTVIGQRQLWQLNATMAEAIALVIDSAKGDPAIAELGAY
jgi:alpha-L-fucosidase